MKVTAIIATRNAEQYIGRCLGHLYDHGVDVILLDNESTDKTLAIAASSKARVVHTEKIQWHGCFDLARQLGAKERIVKIFESDWWIHLDVDEIPTANRAGCSLVEGIGHADKAGYNVINFDEFVFMPEDKTTDYAHGDYVRDMRYYYFFQPSTPRLMRAWKARDSLRISYGGHEMVGKVRLLPESFCLRHYMHLSWDHILNKYPKRCFSAYDVRQGWHVNRINLKPADMRLPALTGLKKWTSGDLSDLDRSDPKTTHFWQW